MSDRLSLLIISLSMWDEPGCGSGWFLPSDGFSVKLKSPPRKVKSSLLQFLSHLKCLKMLPGPPCWWEHLLSISIYGRLVRTPLRINLRITNTDQEERLCAIWRQAQYKMHITKPPRRENAARIYGFFGTLLRH